MSPAAAWRWCLAAGVATFIASSGFGWIGPPQLCGPGYGPFSAVLSFEFVHSPAEVARLFGGGPCRTAMLAAMRRAQWWDALAFIPAYTAFLIFGTIAAGRGAWRWATVAMLVAAGLLDQVEGALMFAVMRALPGTQATIDWLIPVVHAKFALLALGTVAIGWMLGARQRPLAMIAGLAIVGGGLVSLYGLMHLPDARLMSGMTWALTALLITALCASVNPSLFWAGRAAPPRSPASPSA